MAQRHKGERVYIASRPPKRVADALRARANERGISVSEYVAAVLASDVGLPDAVPLPAAPESPQQELPLVG
jgi:hypothetical protein